MLTIDQTHENWLCERCYLYALAGGAPTSLLASNPPCPVLIQDNQLFCPICSAFRHTADKDLKFIRNGNVRGVGPITQKGMWRCYACAKNGHNGVMTLSEHRCYVHAGNCYQPRFGPTDNPEETKGFAIVPTFADFGFTQYLCSGCLTQGRYNYVTTDFDQKINWCAHCTPSVNLTLAGGLGFHRNDVAMKLYYLPRTGHFQSREVCITAC
jgi:hypothetical protein